MRIKLSEIQIPLVPPSEEFGRLKESIASYGLLHPIVVKGDRPPYQIVAGKQRFIATRALGLLEIEATVMPESTTNALEISLHENLRRHNLQWQEQVTLEKELHDLRISQYGKRRLGTGVGNPTGWTQNDTAKELGISIGVLSEDLKLAAALTINPELRNVNDKKTALRLVKLAVNREQIEKESLLSPKIAMNQVLCGPSQELLKHFPDETFDVCLTDPPWSEYKDEGIDQKTFVPVFKEVFRVLKRDAILYVVTSTTDWYFWDRELQTIGFEVQKFPIIWQKPKTISRGRKPWQYARDFEPIIVAAKGNPTLTSGLEFSAVLYHDNVPSARLIHPHEKPISLIKQLLQQCSYEGAKVVDPFAGSGVVGDACQKMKRHYVIIEKDFTAFQKIEKRLNSEMPEDQRPTDPTPDEEEEDVQHIDSADSIR